MKGLILKDLYNAMTQGKALLFMVVIFGVCFANAAEGTLIIMCTIYAAVLVINNMALDEMCAWETFALTMPVTRRQLALSKYVISVIYAFGGTLLGAIMTVVLRVAGFGGGGAPLGSILVITGVGMAISALFIAVLIPVNFKFGIQKGRFVLLSIAALIGGGGVLLSGSRGTRIMAAIGTFGEINGMLAALIAAAAVAVILVVSFGISVKIMEKKEF